MKSLIAGIGSAVVAALVAVGCSSSTSPANTPPPHVQIEIDPAVIVAVDTTEYSVCTAERVSPRANVGTIVGSSVHTETCTPTAYTDTTICPQFNPNPASAAAGESVTWFNNSGEPITLFDVSSGNTPIVTIPAGGTSNGVYWSQQGTVSYSASTCVITGHNPNNDSPPQQTIYITAS